MQGPDETETAPDVVRVPSDDDLDRFDEDLASVASALDALDADDLEMAEALTDSLSAPLDEGDEDRHEDETDQPTAAPEPASDGTGDDLD